MLQHSKQQGSSRRIQPNIITPTFNIRNLFSRPRSTLESRVKVTTRPLLTIIHTRRSHRNIRQHITRRSQHSSPRPIRAFYGEIIGRNNTPKRPFLSRTPTITRRILRRRQMTLVVTMTPITNEIVTMNIKVTRTRCPTTNRVFVVRGGNSLSWG